MVAAGATLSVPLVDWPPLHPPLAVQAVALELVQVSVDALPALMVAGFAVIVTAGGGGETTVTAAFAVPWPPGPEHVRV